MFRGLILSAIFHLLLIASFLSLFPNWLNNDEILAISVDIISAEELYPEAFPELTQFEEEIIERVEPVEAKEDQKIREVKRVPQQLAKTEPSEAEPEPEIEPEAEPEPEPEIEPEPEAKAEPKPKITKPKPEKIKPIVKEQVAKGAGKDGSTEAATVNQVAKPAPVNDPYQSFLGDLRAAKEADLKRQKAALAEASGTGNRGQAALSAAQVRNVRSQDNGCWSNIIGDVFTKEEISEVRVKVYLSLDIDGFVKNVKLVDEAAKYSDLDNVIYRRVANSFILSLIRIIYSLI